MARAGNEGPDASRRELLFVGGFTGVLAVSFGATIPGISSSWKPLMAAMFRATRNGSSC
jgi:hypothetical protein